MAPSLPSRTSDNGECPRFIQLEQLPRPLLSSRSRAYSRTTTNPSTRCVSSSLPIRDLYASSCPQITLVFTAFRVFTLITTPPFRLALQNALLFASPPPHPSCLPLARAILFRARGGGRSHPHILIKQSSNSLAGLTPARLDRVGRGCPQRRSCGGKAHHF